MKGFIFSCIFIPAVFIFISCATQWGQDSYSQLWVIKLDSHGEIEWETTYSRQVPTDESMSYPGEIGYKIISAAHHEYIIVGESIFWDGSKESSMDLLIRINSNGQVIDDFAYYTNQQSRLLDIEKTGEDGYIAVGEYEKSAWITMIDNTGHNIWDNVYDDYYSANTVISSISGDIIIGGELRTSYSKHDKSSDYQTNRSFSFQSDVWIMKHHKQFILQWVQEFGNESDEVCVDILETFRGNYIIAGNAYSNGNKSIWVRNITTNGDILWQNTYSNKGFIRIYQLANSNVLLLNTQIPQEIVLDKDGSVITNIYIDLECQLIELTSDHGYIAYQNDMIHDKMGNIILRKLNNEHTLQWQAIIQVHPADFIQDMLETVDGGYILVGRKVVEDQNDLFR